MSKKFNPSQPISQPDISHNILFSQVREDPKLEKRIVNQLYEADHQQPLTVMIIASGGCTALSLISPKIKHLDLVDSNQEQLYLCQLKLALCQTENSPNRIMGLLNGWTGDNWDLVLQKLLKTYPNCYEYWKTKEEWLAYGPNRMGKFEELFRQLKASNFNFEEQFEIDNLIKIFGEPAVCQSLNNKFSDHFHYNVYNSYRYAHQDPETNYFYYSILHDDYPTECRPPYINYNHLKRLQAHLTDQPDSLQYHCQTLIDHLKNTPDNHYHFIQTSNLTDWSTPEELQSLINELHRCLKPDGKILMRRLNGDLPLNQIQELKKYFLVEHLPINPACKEADQSYFYQEIVVLTTK